MARRVAQLSGRMRRRQATHTLAAVIDPSLVRAAQIRQAKHTQYWFVADARDLLALVEGRITGDVLFQAQAQLRREHYETTAAHSARLAEGK